jgi:hypothetical protein
MTIPADELITMAKNLLDKLYDVSEGDEWFPQSIYNLYNEIRGNYAESNLRIRNNILQVLVADKLIEVDAAIENIRITSEGKKFLNKMPSLIDKHNTEPRLK